MKRIEIIKRLGDFTREEGIAFLSEEDATGYYMSLVELIEEICAENKTGDSE